MRARTGAGDGVPGGWECEAPERRGDGGGPGGGDSTKTRPAGAVARLPCGDWEPPRIVATIMGLSPDALHGGWTPTVARLYTARTGHGNPNREDRAT